MPDTPIYNTIDLEKLILDPFNPRLPKSYHGASEEKILEYMLLDASLIELMMAIGQNGYFPGEQLLVVKDTRDKYKVVEGNRRLSAVKLLNNPGLATVQRTKIDQVIRETKERPTKIPCLIFNKEEGIHNYLGYRHITGIKEWKLLEKARYLYGLWRQSFSGLDIDEAAKQIAKIIGSRKDYVKRILVGFQVYKRIEDEKFFKIRDLDDTSFYFNYIADSLNKAKIAEYLGIDFNKQEPAKDLNPTHLRQWTTWLYEKNEQNRTRMIGDSADLTKLNKILGNETAKKAFIDQNVELERAYELTEDLSEIFRNSIRKSLQNLEQADNVVHRINNFYPEMEEDLTSIRKLSVKIKNAKEIAEDEKL
jgi:hypothetical protein